MLPFQSSDFDCVIREGEDRLMEMGEKSSYFKYNQPAIKLMSTSQIRPSEGRRTSERRRLKMLRNSDEFRMPNPYKLPSPNIPTHLSAQLRSLPTLSLSTIAALSFPLAHPPELLALISQANADQLDKYYSIFGNDETAQNSEECEQRHIQEIPDENHSEIGEEGMSAEIRKGASELGQTREQISINVFEPHEPLNESMFCCLEEPQLLVQPEPRLPHPTLLDNQYENYFS